MFKNYLISVRGLRVRGVDPGYLRGDSPSAGSLRGAVTAGSLPSAGGLPLVHLPHLHGNAQNCRRLCLGAPAAKEHRR